MTDQAQLLQFRAVWGDAYLRSGSARALEPSRLRVVFAPTRTLFLSVRSTSEPTVLAVEEAWGSWRLPLRSPVGSAGEFEVEYAGDPPVITGCYLLDETGRSIAEVPPKLSVAEGLRQRFDLAEGSGEPGSTARETEDREARRFMTQLFALSDVNVLRAPVEDLQQHVPGLAEDQEWLQWRARIAGAVAAVGSQLSGRLQRRVQELLRDQGPGGQASTILSVPEGESAQDLECALTRIFQGRSSPFQDPAAEGPRRWVPPGRVGRVFEAFAQGSLRSSDDLFAMNAEPDGGQFFHFAEFAILAADYYHAQGDAQACACWRAYARHFVYAEHLFVLAYAPSRSIRPLSSADYTRTNFDLEPSRLASPQQKRALRRYCGLGEGTDAGEDSGVSWMELQRRHAAEALRAFPADFEWPSGENPFRQLQALSSEGRVIEFQAEGQRRADHIHWRHVRRQVRAFAPRRSAYVGRSTTLRELGFDDAGSEHGARRESPKALLVAALRAYIRLHQPGSSLVVSNLGADLSVFELAQRVCDRIRNPVVVETVGRVWPRDHGAEGLRPDDGRAEGRSA